jgi:antitoxin (DNA-binding transcriptional repressor) of toxin-antitoxin stability system
MAKSAKGVIDIVATGSYIIDMKAVGIKTLKNRLSEYVRMAARGEVVLVTDRDQVVAELRPPSPGRIPVLQDALLAEAVRNGLLRPPLTAGAALPSRRPKMPLADLLRGLDQDRAER